MGARGAAAEVSPGGSSEPLVAEGINDGLYFGVDRSNGSPLVVAIANQFEVSRCEFGDRGGTEAPRSSVASWITKLFFRGDF
jgi:hypothetical protein